MNEFVPVMTILDEVTNCKYCTGLGLFQFWIPKPLWELKQAMIGKRRIVKTLPEALRSR